MSKRGKVLQIIPVSKPLLAVFRDDDSKGGIETAEVYGMELVELESGVRYERGIIAWEGFENTEDMNRFIGYVSHKEEGFKLYGNHKKEAIEKFRYFEAQGKTPEQIENLKDDLSRHYKVGREIFEEAQDKVSSPKVRRL